MDITYLLKVGELNLKGSNLKFFEKKLRANIKKSLKGIPSELRQSQKRLILRINESHRDQVEKILSQTFGLVSFTPMVMVKKDPQSIETAVCDLVSKLSPQELEGTFKVAARRVDKSYPQTSYEIACDLGGVILDTFPKTTVNVRKPDWVLSIEIRNEVYIYIQETKAPGGLPVGTAGRGLLLLSGGIDSPVAGYLMGKRGLKLESIYFHTYPYTSDEAKEKVVTLGKRLSPWLGGMKLHIIPFTDIQHKLAAGEHPRFSTILMRMAMMKIAEKLGEQRDLSALITGEALSQVASQTVESINCTNRSVDIPVLRPLIGMDKIEIITIARAIDTYDVSILPYDDCCSLFAPKHPVIHPKYDELAEAYEDLNLGDLLDKALEARETLDL